MFTTNFQNTPQHLALTYKGCNPVDEKMAIHRGVICKMVQYEKEADVCERITALVKGIFGSLACCCLCSGFCESTWAICWTGKQPLLMSYPLLEETEDSYISDERELGFNPTKVESVRNYLKENEFALSIGQAMIRGGGRRPHTPLGRSYGTKGHDFYPYFRASGPACFIFIPYKIKTDKACSITCFDPSTGNNYKAEEEIVSRGKFFIRYLYPQIKDINNLLVEELFLLVKNGFIPDACIYQGIQESRVAEFVNEQMHLLHGGIVKNYM
ncbi:MAG: hypothetical protein ACSNEK_01795 [Parachlamydiaceae bacterium]